MMNMNDTNNLNRRQDDRFQPPTEPLVWEVRKRREDDWTPPEYPLEWEDEPNHHNES